MSKFKQLHPNDKENIYNAALLVAFVLCLFNLKAIVKALLLYVDFCEKIFN